MGSFLFQGSPAKGTLYAIKSFSSCADTSSQELLRAGVRNNGVRNNSGLTDRDSHNEVREPVRQRRV